MGALRSGAGLATVGIPRSLVFALARKMTEVMTLSLPETKAGTISEKAFSAIKRFSNDQDVLAIGPGLSWNRSTQALVRRVVLDSKKPMVIDADGLNAFQGKAALFRRLKAPAIVTPHAGEFVRLFGGAIPRTERERKRRALEAARKFQLVVVLKGHHTVVASPEGKVAVNQTGNPGMATAGSGDVLTGVVAAMMGQGLQPFEAAAFGVFVHGLAGDLAARKMGQISLVAGDILDALPLAFKRTLK